MKVWGPGFSKLRLLFVKHLCIQSCFAPPVKLSDKTQQAPASATTFSSRVFTFHWPSIWQDRKQPIDVQTVGGGGGGNCPSIFPKSSDC